MRNLKRVKWITVLVIAGVGLGGWLWGYAEGSSDSLYTALGVMSNVLNRVGSEYVEEVDLVDLVYSGIKGMVATLDPHSQFLDQTNYGNLMTGTRGSFEGLGIEIAIRNGVLTVVSPLEGTPAYRIGIRGGDKIVQIEGESTAGITTAGAVEKLRGPRGTQVTITIAREGEREPFDVTITRDVIKLKSVPYSFMMDDGIGYVRISQFSEDTTRELETALDELSREGLEGLIVDLRTNPGGLLTQAVAVSDKFLERGDLIVSTRGRKIAQNQSYYARQGASGAYTIVVLVNGSSASASEIVAGAIQDHDRGLVVGKRSFGKGSVQTVTQVGNGCALKLTTAKYYTPSGRCIHRDNWEEDAETEVALSGDEEERETFHTEQGRDVFGGGGIMPDVVVELKRLSDLALLLERGALFFSYATQWTSRMGEAAQIPEVGDEIVSEFRDLLVAEEIEFEDEAFEAEQEYIRRAIRREIADRLEGHEAAVRVAIVADLQVLAAVDLLKEANSLTELFEIAAARQADLPGDDE
ncbi:MAG: S41 family peptidase [Candidatus Eisenbacteria sp.]|nr:S41 family peptidase [Candidatus Eisenbacteria bacterium]